MKYTILNLASTDQTCLKVTEKHFLYLHQVYQIFKIYGSKLRNLQQSVVTVDMIQYNYSDALKFCNADDFNSIFLKPRTTDCYGILRSCIASLYNVCAIPVPQVATQLPKADSTTLSAHIYSHVSFQGIQGNEFICFTCISGYSRKYSHVFLQGSFEPKE